GRPIHVDLALHLRGRKADGEGAQTQAEVAHLRMTLIAGGGSPQGGVRLLPWLGLPAAARHLPVPPVELVLLVGPAADDVLEGLLPHLAALRGVDAETLELGSCPGSAPP